MVNLLTKIRDFKNTHLPKESLRARFATGAFWALVGTMISRGLNVLASIVAARFLGKAGYGELGMIQSTIGMFGAFAGFGIGMTATKYVAEYRLTDPDRTTRIIGMSTAMTMFTGSILSLVLIVLSPWLSRNTLAAPHLAGILRVSSGILFFSALNGAQTGALAGFEAFKSIARVSFFSGLLSFPLMIAGVLLGNLNGAVWALVASMAVNYALSHMALRFEARRAGITLNMSDCFRERKILWSFSLPAILCTIMVGPVNWSCAAILVNQPNGYAEMGIYNVANQWQAVILFFPATLSASLLPILCNFSGEGNLAQYRKLFWYNVWINGSIALLITSIIAIASKWIMLSYGNDFVSGKFVLIMMSVSATIFSVNTVVGSAIISSGRLWIGFIFNVLWAVSMLTAGNLLIPIYGAFGLALSSVIAYTLHSIWQMVYVRRFLIG